MKKTINNINGFTLVELLVSAGIMAIIVAGMTLALQ